MQKNNLKVFIIDLVLSIFLTFILMFGFYFIYNIFPELSRIVLAIVILLLIPFVWGNIIFSLLGRKSFKIRKNGRLL